MKSSINIITFCFLVLLVSTGFAQSSASKAVPSGLLTQLLALNGDISTLQKPKYFSPGELAVSPDKKSLYITGQTAKQVAVFDVASKKVTRTIQMPNEPTGIAVSPDGAKLYVTCSSERWPAGMVCVTSAATGAISKRIPAGHSSRAPVVTPDGSKLYVCNWFDNDLSVIDLGSQQETGRIPMIREPYAASITPNGATLVVTNSLPDQKATDTNSIACKVSLISTATGTARASVPLPVGSHSLFGVCVTPDGKYAFATHLVGRFTIPATTLTGGWVHSNNLAIIDIENDTLLNDVALDYATQGLSNPWGVRTSDDGAYVGIAHAGSDDLTLIDLPQLIVKAKAGADLSHDFNAIMAIKKISRLSIRSPRAIAFVDNKVYLPGYFSDSMSIVTVTSLSDITREYTPLGDYIPRTMERQGESNFIDATICFQRWQSCFSCHPFTRPDALNWILNSPNSFTKNVKSMLLTWQTPPGSWAGKRQHAGGPDGSIRSGISQELFLYPSEDIALPLDTFIMRLKPVPSPFLEKGRLSAAAERGKKVYTQVACNYCHPAPLYTDNLFHNAGVPDPFDANTQWDTPTVIETWRTSPYGHLGSYENLQGLKDILLLQAHSIGAASLSKADFDDLVEFVLSL